MSKEYKITAPDGLEAVEKEENGVIHITFKPVKKEINFKSIVNNIAKYRFDRKHNYYINDDGFFNIYSQKGHRYSFNNNTKNKIRAQQLQLIYQGLIEMYDDVELDWNNSSQNKYFIGLSNVIETRICYTLKLQGAIYSSSKEILDRVIKEMGEDNIIFMLKNI